MQFLDVQYPEDMRLPISDETRSVTWWNMHSLTYTLKMNREKKKLANGALNCQLKYRNECIVYLIVKQY